MMKLGQYWLDSQKNAKPVMIGDKEYPSLAKAALAVGMSPAMLRTLIKRDGKLKDGTIISMKKRGSK